MSSLTYSPIDLSTSTIRLLRLFKGRRNYDELIRCELFEAPLPGEDDAPDDIYEALSYTWGDAKHTVSIIVDGQPTSVTTNLRDALYHLRYANEDRILWVDAVCINQRDDVERTYQVGRMRLVYRKAERVIIWLGRTNPKIDLLMDAVRVLDKKVLARPKPQNTSDTLQIWHEEGRPFVADMKRNNPDFYELRQQALQELLERPWFSRIWVIQEAANASKAMIQCSWNSVPTRAFALMPTLMDLQTKARSQALLDVMPGPLRQQSWWRNDRRLCTLLQKFSHSDSTEKRDQIFALLGISFDPATPECPLRADYQLAMPYVIQKTISYMVFGEISAPQWYQMPFWSLEKLRETLPILKPSLLEFALRKDNAALVRKLIHGRPRIDVNSLPGHPNPLHLLVSSSKSIDTVEALLERDDVDVDRELEGLTPLGRAIRNRHIDIACLLSSRPSISPTRRDSEGRSPVERAVDWNHIRVLEAMLSKLTCADREVLLVYAAAQNKISTVRFLREKGVSANAQNPFSLTALEAATIGGHTGVVKFLLKEGADPNLRGRTDKWPLWVAIDRRDAYLVRLLLDAGADPNSKDSFGTATLCYATSSIGNEAFEIMKLLVSRGANMDSRDRWDRTALHHAAERGYEDTVELLLDAGSSMEAKCGKYQTTALWVAVLSDRTSVVECLADRGADLTIPKGRVSGRVPHLFDRHWQDGEKLDVVKFLQDWRVPSQASRRPARRRLPARRWLAAWRWLWAWLWPWARRLLWPWFWFWAWHGFVAWHGLLAWRSICNWLYLALLDVRDWIG